MWQVSGRNAITNFDEIVKLDLKYIDNWSIWEDIKIIIKTVLVLFKREGAY
jgi:lipopolysaccharide/colanic/teichoic acid biosynthesis glycosyltransferase